jgi:hypothetical protein
MLDRDTLEAALRALPPAPLDLGVVQQVVLRLPEEGRHRGSEIRLKPGCGAVGDRWVDGKADPEAEVTLMRSDVAGVMCAGGDPAILGDNLFVLLDTSAENLPAGAVLRLGGALCAVTAKPHRGCAKFKERVGADAWAVTLDPGWRSLNLRGVHLRVLEEGLVRVGDRVEVVSR